VIRLVVAVALLAASQARAEQVEICEQMVDYKPTGIPSPERTTASDTKAAVLS
jgi:hypothetical protein